MTGENRIEAPQEGGQQRPAACQLKSAAIAL
jgi:hypothetical protein